MTETEIRLRRFRARLEKIVRDCTDVINEAEGLCEVHPEWKTAVLDNADIHMARDQLVQARRALAALDSPNGKVRRCIEEGMGQPIPEKWRMPGFEE